MISILGTCDLDYIVTLLSLCRLGYTALLLSPRLTTQAYANLISETSSQTLLYAKHLQGKAVKIQSAREGLVANLLFTRHEYDVSNSGSIFRREVHGPSETLRKVFILHSSGSTSLPRPIHFTHKRLLAACAPALGFKAFLTVPLFHTHGLCVFFQTLYKQVAVYCYNSNMPQTHDGLVQAIQAAKPEIIYTVPYVLKLLAEEQDGIDLLKSCKLVSYSGSRCPDELGNRLTEEGVRIGSVYGS